MKFAPMLHTIHHPLTFHLTTFFKGHTTSCIDAECWHQRKLWGAELSTIDVIPRYTVSSAIS